MPSATTLRPRLWARSMVECTILASCTSLSMFITNRAVDLQFVNRQALEVSQ